MTRCRLDLVAVNRPATTAAQRRLSRAEQEITNAASSMISRRGVIAVSASASPVSHSSGAVTPGGQRALLAGRPPTRALSGPAGSLISGGDGGGSTVHGRRTTTRHVKRDRTHAHTHTRTHTIVDGPLPPDSLRDVAVDGRGLQLTRAQRKRRQAQ